MFFSSIGEAGGGGARRSRVTVGAAAVGGFALADAVLRAQVLDIGADGGLEVNVGAAVCFEALLGFGPVCGRRERAEHHKAMAPAEAAVGFAP